MRWPIRNQILVPFVLIQIVTIAIVAAFAVWTAIQQVDRELHSRLDGVTSTIESASYPLTPAILEELHRLSTAHLIVLDDEGKIVGTTLKASIQRQQNQISDAQSQNSTAIKTLFGQRYLSRLVTRKAGTQRNRVLILYSESRFQAARSQAILPPILIGIALVLLTTILSMWIASRFSNRIRQLQSQVSRIAHGDFTPVPLSPVDDELRELTESINSMSSALDQSLDQLKDTERSFMLTQLVGGLAHQLRNSLTGARVSIQLHQRRCPQSEDQSIQIALKQLSLTEEQMKALLRVSRGHSSRTVPGQLGELLADAISLVQPLCVHQQIELTSETSNIKCSVPDSDALRGAFLNILINAIEATGPSGSVHVNTSVHQQQIAIEISNTGPPIPPKVVQQMFQAFFTTKPEGAGLGLALAVQAAEDNGGSLEYISGERTTFRFVLPCPTDELASTSPSQG
ncbi:HAMP domain-containing sensor histidine kinase [Thalassoglobus sp. JC818]|uniref:sensor histidine kinase n=1 Tax=Thalassoglobus sp. JC818 TaxID=3232136 RepID=UPI003457A6C4